MLQRAYILGNVSQERFSDVGISWFRASRGAGAGLLEICMHFSSSLRARAARLCVRPNNLCAFRICSLGVRPKDFRATRFARFACVLIPDCRLPLPLSSQYIAFRASAGAGISPIRYPPFSGAFFSPGSRFRYRSAVFPFWEKTTISCVRSKIYLHYLEKRH